MTQPILPRGKINPLGRMASKPVKKVFEILDNKYEQIKDEVDALIATMRYEESAVNNAFYFNDGALYTVNETVKYSLTPAETQSIFDQITNIIDEILLEGGKRNLWLYEFTAQEGEAGSIQAFQNLAAQSDIYAERVFLQQILTSPTYINLVNIANNGIFDSYRDLTTKGTQDLNAIIGDAIVRGIGPKELSRILEKRLGVSKSSARYKAQTVLLGTYRRARVAESQRAEDEYGIITELLWTSALMATTRPWHASRHGKTYTRQEVLDFYADISNASRCYCAQTEVLMLEGKPQISAASLGKMEKELEHWEKFK